MKVLLAMRAMYDRSQASLVCPADSDEDVVGEGVFDVCGHIVDTVKAFICVLDNEPLSHGVRPDDLCLIWKVWNTPTRSERRDARGQQKLMIICQEQEH